MSNRLATSFETRPIYDQTAPAEFDPLAYWELAPKQMKERIYCATERELRANRWYARHAQSIPVACGNAWPPIDLSPVGHCDCRIICQSCAQFIPTVSPRHDTPGAIGVAA